MGNTTVILSALAAVGLTTGCSRSDNTGSSATSREIRNAVDTNQLYSSTTTKDADNTGRNVRDRSDAALTPGDQGSNDSDRDITRRIRRTLNTNDQFSTDAKNIKIITTDGKVTLRGPVKSQQEQQAIVAAAQTVAGPAPVDNQLEIKQ